MILVQLKKKFVWKIIFFLSMGLLLFSRQEFKRIEQWQHDRLMPGHLFDAVVDQDGDLIAAFQKAGVKIANKNKIVDFGPLGQGPNDLDGFFTLCFYKGNLAVEGMAGKLKIFHKNGGKYFWKQTIWKQGGEFYHPVKDGKFIAGKWFFSGPDSHRIGKNKVRTYYLRVYNEKGKYIKSLIEEKKRIDKRIYMLIDYFLDEYKDSLLFISEYEPVLKIISPQSMEVKKEVILEMPLYYKPMPEKNYFLGKEYLTKTHRQVVATWAVWKTNYSRIERIAVDDNRLVLQIRTCSKDLKRYALLLYNLETFKLDRTVMTDDLLLAVKDGKYYLFENGHPGYDDDAGDFVINIHQFKETGKIEKK